MTTIQKAIKKIARRIIRPLTKKSYGLNGLDVMIYEQVKFRKGSFIEVGANDGIKQSNTLYLEKYYGWRGVLIEAVPELAEMCRRNRPKAIVVNAALVPFGYDKDKVTMEYCDLMSMVRDDDIMSAKGEEHLRKGVQLQKGVARYRVDVAAKTMMDVVVEYKLSTVDLLIVDVEGYEPQLLGGIDFALFKPKYILVEVWDRNAIEDVIGSYYRERAVLSDRGDMQDILYELR